MRSTMGGAVGIFESQNLSGNFDEVTVGLGFIPGGEDIGHGTGLQTQPVPKQLVGLG